MTESVEERWVGVNEARGAWATAAGEILTDVAGHYGAVITYSDFAEQVQARTGLRTRSSWRNWMGGVVAAVVAECKAAGLPPLTSLVAHRTDLEVDDAIIRARLLCYRRFADDVPAEVIAEVEAAAAAERAAAEEAARERAAKPRRQASSRAPRAAQPPRPPARKDEPPKICPTCFVQLPASGICDTCG